MLNKDQIIALYKDEEFIKKVKEKKTKEGVLEVLAEYGLKYDSIEDLQKDVAGIELSEEELENVAGGTTYAVCPFIGFGAGDQCLLFGCTICLAVGI